MAFSISSSASLLSFRSLFLLFCALTCAYLGACCTLLFVDTAASQSPSLFSGLRRRTEAPLDDAAQKLLVRQELGRSSWQLLHRLAASFDKAPSLARRAEVAAFFQGLSVLYPCPECAAHFRELLLAHPIEEHTRDNRALSLWLCSVHNKVNEKLGKPLFSCTIEALAEKWGSCGCFDLPGKNASSASSPAVTQ